MDIRYRLRVWSMLLVLLSLWLSSSMALAQSQPPAPTAVWQYRTPGVPQPEHFNLVQNRQHFVPGAATPIHTHPGQVVVTMLEGENTFTMGDMTNIYHAGDHFIELPGIPGQARNTGTDRMSVMATYVLPWGAPLSQVVPGDTTPPPRGTISYQFRTDVGPMPDPFDVAQQELEFAPGAATPWHTHPGLVMVTVLAGELTFTYDGVTTVYREGESFIEAPNHLAQARNASAAPTRVMASALLPPGAPFTQPQAGPGATPMQLPNTGEGPSVAWLGLLAGVVFLAGGWWLRRRLVGR